MSDNKFEIRFKDDGRNWQNKRLLDMGETGDFLNPIVARQMGYARHRVYEFATTAPIRCDLIAVSAMVEAE